jgi:hypothetical protein
MSTGHARLIPVIIHYMTPSGRCWGRCSSVVWTGKVTPTFDRAFPGYIVQLNHAWLTTSVSPASHLRTPEPSPAHPWQPQRCIPRTNANYCPNSRDLILYQHRPDFSGTSNWPCRSRSFRIVDTASWKVSGRLRRPLAIGCIASRHAWIRMLFPGPEVERPGAWIA